MPEDVIISSVFVALGPFFVADPLQKGKDKAVKGKAGDTALAAIGGKTGLTGLRLDALGLMRIVRIDSRSTSLCVADDLCRAQIFGRHDEQRDWILKEILTSLVKLSDLKKAQKDFKCVLSALLSSAASSIQDSLRLRDGRAIHIVSALLMHLVQSSTHGVREQIERGRNKARSQMIVDQVAEGGEEDDAAATWDAQVCPFWFFFRVTTDQMSLFRYQEAKIYQDGLKDAAKSSKTIASFLLQSYVLYLSLHA